jgi:hypothetical protein
MRQATARAAANWRRVYAMPVASVYPSYIAKAEKKGRKRDLALFNFAIDSKLRGCDVVAVRVDDVAPSGYAMDHHHPAKENWSDQLWCE